MAIDEATLADLAEFPDRLAGHFAAIPPAYRHWTPPSWDGIPSEHLTALEQLCHVRDIEIDGYHVRLQRLLELASPELASLDTYELARARGYANADAARVLDEVRVARAQTLERVCGLSEAELARPGHFEGYGMVTVRGLMHYLCSHDLQHLAGLQWLRGQIG